MSVVSDWLMAYRYFPQLTRKGNSTQLFPFSELVLLLTYASQFLKIQPKAFKSVFLLIFLIINTLVINHWEASQTCPCAFVKFLILVCVLNIIWFVHKNTLKPTCMLYVCLFLCCLIYNKNNSWIKIKMTMLSCVNNKDFIIMNEIRQNATVH